MKLLVLDLTAAADRFCLVSSSTLDARGAFNGGAAFYSTIKVDSSFNPSKSELMSPISSSTWAIKTSSASFYCGLGLWVCRISI